MASRSPDQAASILPQEVRLAEGAGGGRGSPTGARPLGSTADSKLGIQALLIRGVSRCRIDRARASHTGSLCSRRLVAEGVGGLSALLEGLLGRSAMRERKEASQATESPESHGDLLGRAGRRASPQRTRMWALMRRYKSDAATDAAASWEVSKLTVLDVPLQTGHSEFVFAA